MLFHPSPVGHGWEAINGKCHPVLYSRRALPDNFSRYVVNVNCDGEDNFDEIDFENDITDGENETDIDEV